MKMHLRLSSDIENIMVTGSVNFGTALYTLAKASVQTPVLIMIFPAL